MIQAVFVILPSADNACIFYGQLDQNAEVDDLGNILGTIVEYAQNLDNDQIKNIQLSQGKFAYGKFEKIYLIFKIQRSDEMEEIKLILQKMANGFIQTYTKELESFSGDISVFEDFSDKIGGYLTFKEESSRPKIEEIKSERSQKTENLNAGPSSMGKKATDSVSASAESDENISKMEQKKGTDLLKRPKPIKFVPEQLPEVNKVELTGDKYIIPPEKRDAYPNGIEDYMRDEIMWNESQAVMKEYTADFVEGIIAKLQIFLSISIVHHYEFIIDFQNYPEKPEIEISETLKADLKDPLENISYFLNNWDTKMPPHIIEIVRELEKILMTLKTEGKLEATAEMPEAALPHLEPLEGLSYMEKTLIDGSSVDSPKIKSITPQQTSQTQKSPIQTSQTQKSPIQTSQTQTTQTKKNSGEIKKSSKKINAPKLEPLKLKNSKNPNEPQLVKPGNIQKPENISNDEEKEKKKKEKEEKERLKNEEKEKKKKEKEEKERLKKEKKEEKKNIKEILKESKKETQNDLKKL